MKSSLTRIGNSKGVRLPSHMLQQLGIELDDDIDIILEDNRIIIKKEQVRTGWANAFKKMHNNGDDKLIDMPELENDVFND